MNNWAKTRDIDKAQLQSFRKISLCQRVPHFQYSREEAEQMKELSFLLALIEREDRQECKVVARKSLYEF